MNIKPILSKEFLESLKYKLSVANSRSIYLNCIPGRYKGRLELSEIEEILPSVTKELLVDLTTKPIVSFELKLPVVDKVEQVTTDTLNKEKRSPKKMIKAKLDYLIQEEREYKDNFGLNTLHFGYPVVAYKKQQDGKFVYAPLLLWELEITKNFSKKDTYILKRTSESGIRINDMFTILVEEDAKILINKIDESLLDDGLLDQSEIQGIVEKIQKQVFSEERNFDIFTDFLKLDKESIKQGQIINTGVIGNFRHLKTPIINEIKRLIENFDISEEQVSDYNFTDLKWQTSSVYTDPSQKNILNFLNSHKNQILQGPPGTGKSQTITALLSKALVNQKTCLVVCEKDAALNVIQENLKKSGINSHIAIKISDPINDRKKFSDIFSYVLDAVKDEGLNHLENKLNIVSDKNIILRKNINEFKKAIYTKSLLSRSFRDLIGVLTSINRTNPNLQSLKHEVLNSLENIDIKSIKDDILLIQTKFNQVKDSFSLLTKFRDEFASTLTPFDFQNIDNNYKKIRDLRNEIEVIFNNLKIVNKSKKDISIKITKVDELVGYFSKNVKQQNLYITELLQKLEQINSIVLSLPIDNLTKLTIDKISDFKMKVSIFYNQVEKLAGLDKLLLFNYKDLLQTRNKLSSESRKIIDYLISKPEYHNTDSWDVLFEKSIVEKILNTYLKNTPLDSGTDLNTYLQDLISGEEEERVLNTNAINILNANNIKNLSTQEGWATKKFYLTQKRGSPKKGPRKSLKKLFHDYLDDILKVSPVILTNPLSACVLFSGQENIFDLVVFDEASQLRLEDTLPSLLMGKKALVSGDKHQMPPSDYFDSGAIFDDEVEEEYEESPVDPTAESLLSFVYNLSDHFDDRMLEFHYRSAHPALIDFSNHAFYDGKLKPTPPSEDYIPIIFKQVHGVYTQKKRINKEEVKEICNLLKSDQIKSDDNIGIATLNLSQRDEIRKAIYQEAEDDIGFREKILSLERNGLFIKNLENLQGDERDIIILSVTFGINENGRFSAFFGQLNNKNKGYRLLNVLVTRAKKKIYIFNSIPTNEFQKYEIYRENNSEIITGRSAFYAYLSYAEAVSKNDLKTVQHIKDNIKIDLGVDNLDYENSYSDSPFEEEVYNTLSRFITKDRLIQQYKAGGFKIDIMILSETYKPLLAIECDGAKYHSDENASSWDLHRQQILEKMGYRFHRIWSTDWWVSPFNEISKIREILKV